MYQSPFSHPEIMDGYPLSKKERAATEKCLSRQERQGKDVRPVIQRITEDDDGNPAIEFDDEGIDYLMLGLNDLLTSDVGTVFVTPAVWTEDAPWWRFWNRSGTPVVGEFRLRKVE